jgi:hypothetical protein
MDEKAVLMSILGRMSCGDSGAIELSVGCVQQRDSMKKITEFMFHKVREFTDFPKNSQLQKKGLLLNLLIPSHFTAPNVSIFW